RPGEIVVGVIGLPGIAVRAICPLHDMSSAPAHSWVRNQAPPAPGCTRNVYGLPSITVYESDAAVVNQRGTEAVAAPLRPAPERYCDVEIPRGGVVVTHLDGDGCLEGGVAHLREVALRSHCRCDGEEGKGTCQNERRSPNCRC